jgi:hypothetical protein
MRDILYYKTATGEITSTANFEDDVLPADIAADLEADEAYMDGVADAALEYITFPAGVPTVTARPTVLADNNVSAVADNTITVDFALATGTTVTYSDTEYVSVAGEHFQFKSNGVIGEYFFLIDPPFPYIPVMPLRITAYAV